MKDRGQSRKMKPSDLEEAEMIQRRRKLERN